MTSENGGIAALKRDTRAQSIGISQLILTLVVGSVMIYLMTVMADAILPGAEAATTNATANRATGWLFTFVDIVPIIILLLGVFGILVLAVFRSEIR